jgi:hypothetical protein
MFGAENLRRGIKFESCSPDHCLSLWTLFVNRSKQLFFEKSAINETSFEWTGVDKNRQNRQT